MTVPGQFRSCLLQLVPTILLGALACSGDVKDNGIDPNSSIAQVFISPNAVSIPVGATLDFASYALTVAGDSIDAPLDWVADGGNLTSVGSFSSATVGTFMVIGRSRVFPNPADTSTVTVTAPPVTLHDIVINPISPIFSPGEVRPFLAEAHFSDSTIAPALVTWTATGGTIDQAGSFTAGSTPGTFRVIATSMTAAVADTVPLTINVIAPVVTSVVLAPDTVTLVPGEVQQFNAFGNYSDGTFAPAAVTYTSTAGTITAAGVYTAPQAPGTYKVIARHVPSGTADTSDVTVSASTLVRITLTPPTVALVYGSLQQFAATGKFSDSSTATVSVNFSATGGTVSTGGLYTAGQVSGPFIVVATTPNGLFADTASVQINAPSITLTRIQIRPEDANVLANAQIQFSSTGQFSDGTRTSVIANYTSTGGSITSGGLFTAPQVTGVFSVIAKIGNIADTATVHVTAQSSLSSIVISPSATTLVVGAVQQFSAVGQLQGGGTSAVSVKWTTSCGAINATGQYSAPGSPTTCSVFAVQQGGTLADTATVTVTNLPPPTTTACTNEPTGLTTVFDDPWNAVPPVAPSKDQFGWNVRTLNEQAKLSIISDVNAPRTPVNAIAGKFPGGSKGGAAPFGLTQIFPHGTTTLYMCVFTEVDTAFTNNGNVGTKFGFFLTPFTSGTFSLNHYFNMTNNLGINLQSGAAQLNRSMLSTFSLIGHRGTWVKVEYLVIANTPGNADGTARVWANGAQVLNVQNVEYFFSTQNPSFTGITWNPTYGGGLNPVPYDQYQFIDHWYLSIK